MALYLRETKKKHPSLHTFINPNFKAEEENWGNCFGDFKDKKKKKWKQPLLCVMVQENEDKCVVWGPQGFMFFFLPDFTLVVLYVVSVHDTQREALTNTEPWGPEPVTYCESRRSDPPEQDLRSESRTSGQRRSRIRKFWLSLGFIILWEESWFLYFVDNNIIPPRLNVKKFFCFISFCSMKKKFSPVFSPLSPRSPFSPLNPRSPLSPEKTGEKEKIHINK